MTDYISRNHAARVSTYHTTVAKVKVPKAIIFSWKWSYAFMKMIFLKARCHAAGWGRFNIKCACWIVTHIIKTALSYLTVIPTHVRAQVRRYLCTQTGLWLYRWRHLTVNKLSCIKPFKLVSDLRRIHTFPWYCGNRLMLDSNECLATICRTIIPTLYLLCQTIANHLMLCGYFTGNWCNGVAATWTNWTCAN